MKRTRGSRSFLNEAAAGFVISVIAAAVVTAGSLVVPEAFVLRLVIAAIGLTCVMRSIRQSEETTGRVITLAVWGGLAVTAWVSGIGLPAYVVLHATLIWLARSLFSYARLLESGLDLGLTTLAVSFGVWAGLRTDSVFLATWCFLLVQALQVAIPAFASGLFAGRQRDIAEPDDDRGFSDAYRAADEAMRRIATRY